MRKILTTIFILTFTVSFSQTEKDLTAIIELVIAEYQSDTIIVYNRFNNDQLLSDLENAKNFQDFQTHEKYGTVEIENINVDFFSAIKKMDKKNNKRIRGYTKTKLKKNNRKPVAYISFPLISTDRKSAIVYGSYICGGLCGSGGIFFLKKINGQWNIKAYENRWIS